MNDPSQQPAKIRFYDICVMYVPDYAILEEIAKSANVDMSTLRKMFAHEVIHRVDAAKILLALSQYIKQTYNVEKTYTLENTRVALYPTIPELLTLHNLDISNLAADEIIEKIIMNDPLTEQEAENILLTISRVTGQEYSLSNVDVVIEGGQHG